MENSKQSQLLSAFKQKNAEQLKDINDEKNSLNDTSRYLEKQKEQLKEMENKKQQLDNQYNEMLEKQLKANADNNEKDSKDYLSKVKDIEKEKERLETESKLQSDKIRQDIKNQMKEESERMQQQAEKNDKNDKNMNLLETALQEQQMEGQIPNPREMTEEVRSDIIV